MKVNTDNNIKLYWQEAKGIRGVAIKLMLPWLNKNSLHWLTKMLPNNEKGKFKMHAKWKMSVIKYALQCKKLSVKCVWWLFVRTLCITQPQSVHTVTLPFISQWLLKAATANVNASLLSLTTTLRASVIDELKAPTLHSRLLESVKKFRWIGFPFLRG